MSVDRQPGLSVRLKLAAGRRVPRLCGGRAAGSWVGVPDLRAPPWPHLRAWLPPWRRTGIRAHCGRCVGLPPGLRPGRRMVARRSDAGAARSNHGRHPEGRGGITLSSHRNGRPSGRVPRARAASTRCWRGSKHRSRSSSDSRQTRPMVACRPLWRSRGPFSTLPMTIRTGIPVNSSSDFEPSTSGRSRTHPGAAPAEPRRPTLLHP